MHYFYNNTLVKPFIEKKICNNCHNDSHSNLFLFDEHTFNPNTNDLITSINLFCVQNDKDYNVTIGESLNDKIIVRANDEYNQKYRDNLHNRIYLCVKGAIGIYHYKDKYSDNDHQDAQFKITTQLGTYFYHFNDNQIIYEPDIYSTISYCKHCLY